ncbi:hypothetical protein Tco_0999397 [Tanacetum coccineum]
MGTPTQVCVRSCPNISAPAGRPFRVEVLMNWLSRVSPRLMYVVSWLRRDVSSRWRIVVIMEYLVNISKRRAFWSLNEDILKINDSDNQYAVSIKEDTAYPCLHSPKTTKERRSIRRIKLSYSGTSPALFELLSCAISASAFLELSSITSVL